MKKTTKRRKMWAVVDDEGRGSQVFTRWGAAKAWAAKEPRDGTRWHVVPFVQQFSGDVVLSREDADRLRAVAHGHLGQDARALVLALLRGG